VFGFDERKESHNRATFGHPVPFLDDPSCATFLAAAMPFSRTDTTSENVFPASGSNGATYDLSERMQATITVPPGSKWTSEPHWHETHTEYLRVLSGRAYVMLSGNVERSVGPDDGVVVVGRGVVHEWKKSVTEALGEDLIMREWTDPADGAKEIFFRNLSSMIGDAMRTPEGSWARRLLHVDIHVLFGKADNWPVLVSEAWPQWASTICTHLMLTAYSVVGWALGCRGIYPRYTRHHSSYD